jgi:aspartate aminotransferase-like enzyme
MMGRVIEEEERRMQQSLETETTPLIVPAAASRLTRRRDESIFTQDEAEEHQRPASGHLIPPWLLLLYSILLLLCGVLIGQGKIPFGTDRSSGSILVVSHGLLFGDDDDGQQETKKQRRHKPPVLYHKVDKHDFGKLKEYSVIHSDRSLNLMSKPFQRVMQDLSLALRVTHNADEVAIIPGSGTYGMEAVARQFSTDRHVTVLRNGYFSYRWTQIFDFAADGGRSIPASHSVLMARPVRQDRGTGHWQYAPCPIEQVEAAIRQERPAAVFAPHVETSTGIMLPDSYLRRVAAAAHDAGGLFVLDCIASGTVWIDMQDIGVDVLISAPQKDWTSPPSSALVMLSQRAVERLNPDHETSFSLSLTNWLRVMDAYEQGGYAYHTTPPTDALREFQRVSVEYMEFGMARLKEALTLVGHEARALLNSRGLVSVAAPGYEAPGVLVYYSPGNNIENPEMVELFREQGLQITTGTRWMIDEPENIKSFRIGLFGLDKLLQQHRTVDTLQVALDHVLKEIRHDHAS